MATSNVIHFPKQSKSAKKKHPKEQCTVLQWIRGGYTFPGKLAPSTEETLNGDVEYLPKKPE